MNSHASSRINRTVADIVLALLLFLFMIMAVMSPTIGNSGYYKFALKDGTVTTMLQDRLNEKTAEIAEKTGIEAKAFEFAVGQNKISTIQREIVKSAFSGANYNYSDSASIESCYADGIREYYRYNGMELDEVALEIAVPMACRALNGVMGIENNREFKNFTYFMGKISIIIAAALLILMLALSFRIFNLSGGRTKVVSHYACSLISAGMALVLLFVVNALTRFSDGLYMTNNDALNYALAGGINAFFLIEALFGVAFIVGGASMMGYVYKYYTTKFNKQKQERDINRTIYVKVQDGDKTIGELVNDRRERTKKSQNIQEKK